MKLWSALLSVCAFCGLANAQLTEPDTDGVFYVLGDNPDVLIPLERQTATIHTSAKFVGIGATAKSSAEFKPGKSPVRVSRAAAEFIVRSPFASSSVDFNSFYVLRTLASKGGKRELVISKAHAYVGTAGSSSNLAEGEVPVTIVKYGQHSLKIIAAQPLGPAEYALSMRAALLNLFCFGIDE
jgi:hypothetical protein